MLETYDFNVSVQKPLPRVRCSTDENLPTATLPELLLSPEVLTSGPVRQRERICQLERGSQVKRPFAGDLNRLFDRVNMHLKSSSNVGIRYPRLDFARMLRGEIQEQDGSIDLSLCPRMQASDLRRPVLNGKACALRPRCESAGGPGVSLEIDDVCH